MMTRAAQPTIRVMLVVLIKGKVDEQREGEVEEVQSKRT